MRLFAFILALLLLAGSVDPTRGWLITLVVVTGIAAMRPRPWNWFHVQPNGDIQLLAFVFAVLLLAGVIDPTRDWLIALTVVTGLAMTAPSFGVDVFGFNHRDRDEERGWRWRHRGGRWISRADDEWDRRMDKRQMQHTDGWGDDWS